MAVFDQVVTDRYAIYHGDSCEVLPTLPENSIHLSVYSPPFAGLYHYSSSERDLSNARSYEEFFAHYDFIVKELVRITMPGRMTAVHCMDVPTGNTGCDHLVDFPGDIIRQHERFGFRFAGRYAVWKEPLAVRNRTMAKNLAHKTIVDDASKCSVASADYLLLFRKKGDNPVPITHPNGLTEYAGARHEPGSRQRTDTVIGSGANTRAHSGMTCVWTVSCLTSKREIAKTRSMFIRCSSTLSNDVSCSGRIRGRRWSLRLWVSAPKCTELLSMGGAD
jgi:hypothetical protein